MLPEVILILTLIAANGIFSAAEIATLSVRPTRLRELVERGSSRARAVEELRTSPERFLATIQVGITIVSTAASAFGGASVAAKLTVLFRDLGLSSYADEVALAVVVASISFLSLMLGELVPKSLALRYSEGYAMLVGRPLQGLAQITRPLVWVLTTATNLFLRLFGDSTSFIESKLSAAELRLLLDEAARSGELNKETGDIARRAIDFEKLTVAEVMVPRDDIVALQRDTSTHEVLRSLGDSGHARLPVCDGTLDNIAGYVTAREVLAQMAASGQVDLAQILRAPYFVPRTMPALEALRELQSRRLRLAMVVDDAGTVQGLVTIEDLVEELVGDILHEHEKPASALLPGPDGSYELPGTLRVRRLNRDLGLALPDRNGITLAGLAISLASGIPRKGDRLPVDAFHTLEIVEATPRKVLRVRLSTARRA